jgi:1,4-alpha-glucan branching enzyme
MTRKQRPQGYWMPVLHAHLPFVKHPEHDYFLEEHWLFEAVSESYIPLLMHMNRLNDGGIDYRMTVSLSPPLLEMFGDEHLIEKYTLYLDRMINLSKKEIRRIKKEGGPSHLALFYKERYEGIRSFFLNRLGRDILNGFRRLRDLGAVELITSCATHGLLPLLNVNHRSVEAQVAVAVDTFLKHVGYSPAGLWLPECAYYDGLDGTLKKHGIRYFFLDSHGFMEGVPVPKYGVYAPAFTAGGVAVFARDPLSSKQVWSAEEGYPGDADYRDFYRDIGFDLDIDYIKPYISPDGMRVFTGIKYFRITGKSGQKEPYDPGRAADTVKRHAAHFRAEREDQVKKLRSVMDRRPVVLSPYDAELFGHWWFEGPDFLYHVLLEIDNSSSVKTITPSEYLKLYPQNQVITPRPTSWGDRGYYDAWLNSENDWMYRHLHHMADRLEGLANAHYHETDVTKIRLLNQLARELLLAQSSDWAFLMTTNTAKEYSVSRMKEHIDNFRRLSEQLESNGIDGELLEWLEYKNSIFSDIDFRVYASAFA